MLDCNVCDFEKGELVNVKCREYRQDVLDGLAEVISCYITDKVPSDHIVLLQSLNGSQYHNKEMKLFRFKLNKIK